MKQITCPVCKTSPSKTSSHQSIISCTGCGTGWTYLSKEFDSEALYSDEVYAIVDNRKSIFERVIFSEAKKVLQKAKSLNAQANTLLDFGSGKGQFLTVAKEMGWKGIGIETARERAAFAMEKYGVEVLSELYHGGIIGSGTFDLITLNHVLEHLPDPLNLVQELLEQNLAPNGLVYIEVPRSDSWQAKLAGANWIHWDIPRHLTHWTERGLEHEFSKIGFQKVDSRRFSIHLGVLGMLQALLSKLGFRENLIVRLKRNKSFPLLISIALLLPFAWILEWVSAKFNKSGILGIYMQRNG
ncbi:Methyltransferase domain-containing protein [Algoriphagus alkaliphilus]|uniref:Methyltransferase domain-containing protein n=1 Tax=Algoriphagus alkaliphilus TaxID=279824 RepID=A0A1G5V031_9BACT|nr:class I SAM-dependent methyltransferase [Algoriphagus alkaliphilus]MBA4300747.1 class I SAM-dependent methyltransferase [Cyclobacterium sp.]SDA38345.1 Methyltransferase domain-containing protein [Algoriphagus alkaliphilus]